MTNKVLKVRFTIPKEKVKNANAPMSHIMSAIKSSWIRAYSEEVWAMAAEEQFGVKAVDPLPENLTILEIPEEYLNYKNQVEELQLDIENITQDLKNLKENDDEYKALKKERTSLKRKKDEDSSQRLEEVEELIFNYEDKLEVLKASKMRRTKTLSRLKASGKKTAEKALRKVEGNNKKNFINERIKANEFQHLFKTCHIAITVYNITKRDFDSPNFSPTTKAILDGGTDAGIIWEDDNNSVILSTTFLAGGNLERHNYIFDIEVFENFEDFAKAIKPKS